MVEDVSWISTIQPIPDSLSFWPSYFPRCGYKLDGQWCYYIGGYIIVKDMQMPSPYLESAFCFFLCKVKRNFVEQMKKRSKFLSLF